MPPHCCWLMLVISFFAFHPRLVMIQLDPQNSYHLLCVSREWIPVRNLVMVSGGKSVCHMCLWYVCLALHVMKM